MSEESEEGVTVLQVWHSSGGEAARVRAVKSFKF